MDAHLRVTYSTCLIELHDGVALDGIEEKLESQYLGDSRFFFLAKNLGIESASHSTGDVGFPLAFIDYAEKNRNPCVRQLLFSPTQSRRRNPPHFSQAASVPAMVTNAMIGASKDGLRVCVIQNIATDALKALLKSKKMSSAEYVCELCVLSIHFCA